MTWNPIDVERIQAMDRLNNYARWHGRIVSSAVIYALKELAIRDLSARGHAIHRRIMYRSTCSVCSGTGWFRRPGLRGGDGCRRCGGGGDDKGRGWTRLSFVESTIAGGAAVWHTPTQKIWGLELWQACTEPARGPDGWRPRLPGIQLDAHELCRDLVAVERWVFLSTLFVPEFLRSYQIQIAPGSMAELEPAVIEWRRLHPKHVVIGDDEIPF